MVCLCYAYDSKVIRMETEITGIRFGENGNIIRNVPIVPQSEPFLSGDWENQKQQLIETYFYSRKEQLSQYKIILRDLGQRTYGRVYLHDKLIILSEKTHEGREESMINTLKHELIHAYLYEQGKSHGHNKEFWTLMKSIGYIPNHSFGYAKAEQIANNRGRA